MSNKQAIIGVLRDFADKETCYEIEDLAEAIEAAINPTFSKAVQIQAVGDAEFDGPVEVTPRHEKKLRGHLEIVFEAIKDGAPRSQKELEEATGLTWSQISPRLRDLRKEKFGGYEVKRQDFKGGIHRYRLLPA